MTDSFGARLRRQRERQHVTLAQIAASTKIQASLFEGLERNDVSRWPGGIFRRSFIRAYAEAIGLNPDHVCREFLERFPEPSDGLGASAAAQSASVASARSSRLEPRIVFFEDAGTIEEETTGPRLVLAEADGASPEDADVPATSATSAASLRWRAAGVDLVAILGLAGLFSLAAGAFWTALAVTSLVYCFGGLLWLGQTPGMAWVGPTGSPAPARRLATVTSLERALELRAALMADSQAAAHVSVEDDDGDRRYAALPAPVDIESRRVRA